VQRIPILVATGVLTATMAAAASIEEMDSNGDSMVTFDELLAVMPGLSEDRFRLVDTDEDGIIDADELANAREKGLLPAT